MRSAHSATHSPRQELVLEAVRKHWLAIGSLRYRQFDDELEDAVQIALIKLISSDTLATLREAEWIEPWARSIFVHTVLDLLRTRERHGRHSNSRLASLLA